MFYSTSRNLFADTNKDIDYIDIRCEVYIYIIVNNRSKKT